VNGETAEPAARMPSLVAVVAAAVLVLLAVRLEH